MIFAREAYATRERAVRASWEIKVEFIGGEAQTWLEKNSRTIRGFFGSTRLKAGAAVMDRDPLAQPRSAMACCARSARILPLNLEMAKCIVATP